MLLLWTMTIRSNGWVLLLLIVLFLAFRLGAWKAVLTVALPGDCFTVGGCFVAQTPAKRHSERESDGFPVQEHRYLGLRCMEPRDGVRRETENMSDWRNIGSYAMRQDRDIAPQWEPPAEWPQTV